ncbi:Fe-only nitrogenase accessory AnfO family protein [Clostridium sp. HBUAS56010]|uniref:Fe-only nitrogenase accessory AnfO family protein n=1 Tax=Clostridium sp. HBUAS56010 TaxID=2571127 RepID=UPI00163D88CC|nr:Fe-only nitrogenase accessory AnfO family protein [Clostridium sp. HBUAS56010]
MDKIAVFSRDETMEAFLRCNLVQIYEEQGGIWERVSSISFVPLKGSSVVELRQETEKIAGYAGNAKAVICKEITGIPFSVIDRKGYGIFLTDQVDEETLNGVIEDLKQSEERKKGKAEMVKNLRPVQGDTPGIYYFNLLEVQKECPEVSSKKALMPFLAETPFLELHLICAHIPPWLENQKDFEKTVQLKKGAVHVTITRSFCLKEG